MPIMPTLGFMNIGGWEWAIILIIALLLFGRRLPEVMRGLGGGVREFRKGLEQGPESDTPAKALPDDAVARSTETSNLAAPSQSSVADAAAAPAAQGESTSRS